jgi:hypothetical protein
MPSSASPQAQKSPLSEGELQATLQWLIARQKASGEIPWADGAKMDPWDHVHSAMGLAAMGEHDAAHHAYRFMVETQDPNGGWAAQRRGGKVTRSTQESNHAAYFASGVWHQYVCTQDRAFLREMWPSLERSVEFVLSMQLPSGAVAWAKKNGRVWQAPLLTGSSSVHGSLVCAIRCARALGHDRPAWRKARERLARVLRQNLAVFSDTDLPEKPGRHSMDWYYPVLGGAVRGHAGRKRLLDAATTAAFLEEGVGCRCVKDKPWYTIAETCELVLALDASGLTQRAHQILSWTRWLRTGSGAYFTGATHPAGEIFPEGEQTSWTAAAVLLAADTVQRQSVSSGFFRSLDGIDLDDHLQRPWGELPSYAVQPPTAAE